MYRETFICVISIWIYAQCLLPLASHFELALNAFFWFPETAKVNGIAHGLAYMHNLHLIPTNELLKSSFITINEWKLFLRCRITLIKKDCNVSQVCVASVGVMSWQRESSQKREQNKWSIQSVHFITFGFDCFYTLRRVLCTTITCTLLAGSVVTYLWNNRKIKHVMCILPFSASNYSNIKYGSNIVSNISFQFLFSLFAFFFVIHVPVKSRRSFLRVWCLCSLKTCRKWFPSTWTRCRWLEYIVASMNSKWVKSCKFDIAQLE